MGVQRCANNDLTGQSRSGRPALYLTLWSANWCHQCFAHAKLCHHLLWDMGPTQTAGQWLKQAAQDGSSSANTGHEATPSLKDVGLKCGTNLGVTWWHEHLSIWEWCQRAWAKHNIARMAVLLRLCKRQQLIFQRLVKEGTGGKLTI